MNVQAAIRERDPAELPGKRDEDWRWTDLRGLIRQVPAASQPVDPREAGQGPFEHLVDASHLVANGRQDARIEVAAGAEAVMGLRLLSRGSGSHTARVQVEVGQGGRLTLLESHEGDDGGYVAHAALDIRLAEGASLERIVLAADGAEGVSVSEAEVTLGAHAAYGQTVVASGARRQRLQTRLGHPGGETKVR